MKMKNCFVPILLLVIVVAFGMSSCEQEKMDVANPYVTIVKFKQPEYKNYICAHYKDGDSLMTINVEAHICMDAVGKAGYSPYWELPDGWLLVDWKWGPLIIYAKEHVVLNGLTWETIEYPITQQHLTWPAATPHILNPVASRKQIDINKLAKYHEPFSLNLYSWGNKMTDSCLCPCELVRDMDEDWSRLQRNLSVAIENGDLEKLLN